MHRVLALIAALVGAAGIVAAATVPASAGDRVEERQEVTASVDAYLPHAPGPTPRPAVLFVHGGGWSQGSRRWWAGHARALTASTGWPSFTVDYDLDADRPWRAQPADVRRALAWVRDHAARFGVDRDRIALVGSSAGGHLALLVGVTGGGARAVVSLAGVTDLTALEEGDLVTELAADMLRAPQGSPRWTALSPVAHVDADDPPMLLVASEDDAVVPSSQSRAMADALADAGVPAELVVLPGAEHVLGTKAMPLVETYLRRALR